MPAHQVARTYDRPAHICQPARAGRVGRVGGAHAFPLAIGRGRRHNGRMLWRWMVLTLAVWVAAAVVPGIECASWQDLLIAALVLGVLNVFVKPVLRLVSLPVILLTLGLFLLAINALLLLFTAWIVKGFHVASFWSALGGSLVISLVSLLLGVSGRRSRVAYARYPPPRPPPPEPQQGPPPGKGPIIDV